MRLAWLAGLFAATALTAQQLQPAAPAEATVLFQNGVASLRAEKYAEADAAFRKVIDLEPDGLRGYLGVAWVSVGQKRPDDAIAFLDATMTKYPARMDLAVATGDCAIRARRYDRALSEFQRVLKAIDEKAPGLAVPRGVPGGILIGYNFASNPLADALNVLSGRDGTPPGVLGLRIRIAESQAFRGDRNAQLEEWQKVAELLPNNSIVLVNIATSQEALGRKDVAEKTYREALRLAPDNLFALNNLAYLLTESGGDLFEALRLARKARSIAPNSTEVQDTLGWIALRQGWIDEAVTTLLKVVVAAPMNADYRNHLAQALDAIHLSPKRTDVITALKAPPAPGDEEKIPALLRALVESNKN